MIQFTSGDRKRTGKLSDWRAALRFIKNEVPKNRYLERIWKGELCVFEVDPATNGLQLQYSLINLNAIIGGVRVYDYSI